MSRYEMLVNILDAIVLEAGDKYPKRYPQAGASTDEKNAARARAFIHLYLKVSFGLLDFHERERFVTDDAYDGGIDGYYIDDESKTITFIQSKFRTTEKNFHEKDIELDEILAMDVDRILSGETQDEAGNQYNGKIKQLQRDLSKVEGIGRYSNRVVILANLHPVPLAKIRALVGGIACQVFDHESCYSKLVFPVVSGTYFTAGDVNINIDLSGKIASKISYRVQTKTSECEITVLFVPTIELAKIMHKYKNSILRFNPRSYLESDGKKVNQAIRRTITEVGTNEFALFNNGVTMLSDDTYINEKIGQKNRAQLTVINPQIINGGQTCYTLSRIYDEHPMDAETIFGGKEVLLKIITLLNKNDGPGKIEFIDEISTATNQQTPVNSADRTSNDSVHAKLQLVLFKRYGILYERKRGEFADGVHSGYVPHERLLERNLFFRLYYAANGRVARARERRLFLNHDLTEDMVDDVDRLDKFYFAYLALSLFHRPRSPNQSVDGSIYAKLRAIVILYQSGSLDDYQARLPDAAEFGLTWNDLYSQRMQIVAQTAIAMSADPAHSKKAVKRFRRDGIEKWCDGPDFAADVVLHFSSRAPAEADGEATK